jgi:hypothetical protein
MGLLEDAIREHLELKRLRGADPAEVAREQREALTEASGVEPAEPSEDQAGVADATADPDGAPTGEPSFRNRPAAAVGDLSSVGEETAELDMQAVLDGEDGMAAEHDSPEGSPAGGGEDSSPASPVEEDSLEWEMPPAASREQGSDTDDQEPLERDPGHSPSDHEPSTEELRDASAEDPRRAPGQGRLSS